MKSKPDIRRRFAIVACAAMVAICLAYDHWRVWLPDWWREHGGGIAYTLFWMSLWFVIFPFRRLILSIGIFCSAMSTLLEILQLWKSLWLSPIRATRIGAALLGSEFAWHDIPPYWIGGAIGYGLLVCMTLKRTRTAPRGGASVN